ncbi:MAG: amidohydrolase family protein [Acidimicrobiales bacterium]|nr:amidohydrolase family protein [Acidimicrobiales bacterium]
MTDPVDVFDLHQHVGGIPGVPGHHPSGALDAAQIAHDRSVRVEAMEHLGIARAALMPAHSYPRAGGLADTRAVNDTLAGYRRSDPQRFPALIGTVEPRYGADGLAEIDRLGELGFQGVSWHHRQQGLAIDHPVMHLYAERMIELGLVGFIHCFPDGDFESVWRLRHLAECHPELCVVCMDAASRFEPFEEALRCAERTANVILDLTSLSLGPAGVRRAIDAVGAARLTFGTNLYSLTQPTRSPELEAVFDADISDVDRRLILGGTARRLLALA